MSANFLSYSQPGIDPRVGIYLVPKMLANAQPVLILERLGPKITPLPKNKGETLKWRRPVPLGVDTTTLVEGVTPNSENFEYETVQDTIDQYGKHVFFSDKIVDLHEDPVASDIVSEQGKQAGNTKELINWQTVRAGTQVIYTGTATARSGVVDVLLLDQIRAAYMLLKANHAMKITKRISASQNVSTEPVNSSFVAVGSQYLEADIRDLDTFLEVSKYGSGGVLDPENEVGKVEEVRFILSPELTPFYGAGSASTTGVRSRDGAAVDVFPLVVVGKESWGITPLSGKDSVSMAFEPPKPSKDDPHGQRGFSSWTMWYCSTILNQSWMVRIETAATDY